jgi:hypothetical protein
MIGDLIDGASNVLDFPTRGVAPPTEPGCEGRREKLIRPGCNPSAPVALPFA